MARQSVVSLVFLWHLLVLQVSAWDPDDDLYARKLPEVLARVGEVAKVLAPVPPEVMDQALYHVASYLVPLDGKTEICRNHSNFLFDSILNHELWAMKMLDASSKVPSGLIDGRIIDLGSPDQCVLVTAPGGRFEGKNCLVETAGMAGDFIEGINPKVPFAVLPHIGLLFTVCIPSTCTHEDLKHHLDVTLNSINASAILGEFNCYTEQQVHAPYTPGQLSFL